MKPWAWARTSSGTVFHMVDTFHGRWLAGRFVSTASVSCRDDLTIEAPIVVDPADFEPGDQACLRCLDRLRRRADWYAELHELARLTRT